MKDKKKIIPVIAFVVLVIAVIGIALQPNFTQVGDDLVTDRYYATAQIAYEMTDGYFAIKEDITTVNINKSFAVWFAETDDNELLMAKMAFNNGKYFSLRETGIYSEKTLTRTSDTLDEELSLSEDTLQYTILPESKYKQSDFEGESVNVELFNFDNKSYAFVYKIVSE